MDNGFPEEKERHELSSAETAGLVGNYAALGPHRTHHLSAEKVGYMVLLHYAHTRL